MIILEKLGTALLELLYAAWILFVIVGPASFLVKWIAPSGWQVFRSPQFQRIVVFTTLPYLALMVVFFLSRSNFLSFSTFLTGLVRHFLSWSPAVAAALACGGIAGALYSHKVASHLGTLYVSLLAAIAPIVVYGVLFFVIMMGAYYFKP